jgi:hypothetical protein
MKPEKQNDPRRALEIIDSTLAGLKQNGLAHEFFDEDGPVPANADSHTMLTIVCGVRYGLNEQMAGAMGRKFQECRRKAPQALYALVMFGYDDDPRELWEIPEVCEYIPRFARYAGLEGAHLEASNLNRTILVVQPRQGPAIRLTTESAALLDQCGVAITGLSFQKATAH